MSDTPSKDKPDSDLSKDAAIQEQRAEQPSDEVLEEQPLDLKFYHILLGCIVLFAIYNALGFLVL